MTLRPQDLRGHHHQKVVHRRANSGISTSSYTDLSPQLGPLGRYWSRGVGLTEPQAARANPSARTATQAAGILTAFNGAFVSLLVGVLLTKAAGLPNGVAVAGALGTWGASVALGFGPLAKAVFRQLHRPLRQSELEPILEKVTDPLDRTFLNLAMDVVRQEIPKRDQDAVREAVAALAQALDRLPEVHPSAVDPTALLAEADATERRSHEESDRLTSDSLQRQADALRRRAAAVDRSALSAKRVCALRAELLAQMEALREGIAAMATDTTEASAVHLAPLSEAVRLVAAEVVSTIDAKAEVDALTSRTSPATDENVQPVGRRL